MFARTQRSRNRVRACALLVRPSHQKREREQASKGTHPAAAALREHKASGHQNSYYHRGVATNRVLVRPCQRSDNGKQQHHERREWLRVAKNGAGAILRHHLVLRHAADGHDGRQRQHNTDEQRQMFGLAELVSDYKIEQNSGAGSEHFLNAEQFGRRKNAGDRHRAQK